MGPELSCLYWDPFLNMEIITDSFHLDKEDQNFWYLLKIRYHRAEVPHSALLESLFCSKILANSAATSLNANIAY